MKACLCCESESKQIIRGLCRRCYNYFYKKGLPINIYYLSIYRPIFKAIDFIDERPLTKDEVSLLINSVEDGTLTKLPHRFWIGMYSYENTILALDYWFRDVLKVDTRGMNASLVRSVLKNSPMSGINSSNFFIMTELFSDLNRVG